MRKRAAIPRRHIRLTAVSTRTPFASVMRAAIAHGHLFAAETRQVGLEKPSLETLLAARYGRNRQKTDV